MRDVGEVRIAAERILDGTASGLFTVAVPEAETAPSAGARWPAVAGLVLVAAVLAGAAGWWLQLRLRKRPNRSYAASRSSHRICAWDRLRAPVLSPDGRRLAYVANGAIHVRDLDQLEPRRVEGSDEPESLMWSSDSQQIGWQSGTRFWRAAVEGGSKTAICDAPTRIFHAVWGPNDRILLTPDDGPLYEVSARGGDPRPILHPVKGAGRGLPHRVVPSRWARVADDACTASDSRPATRWWWWSTESASRSCRSRVTESRKRWCPPPAIWSTRVGGGNNGLWAAPFSLERLELTGEPILIDPEGFCSPACPRTARCSTSGEAQEDERQLVRVDREGRELEPLSQPAERHDCGRRSRRTDAPSPSPLTAATVEDLWLHDVVRGARTRLTFESEDDWAPSWYPDGSTRSARAGLAVPTARRSGGGHRRERPDDRVGRAASCPTFLRSTARSSSRSLHGRY